MQRIRRIVSLVKLSIVLFLLVGLAIAGITHLFGLDSDDGDELCHKTSDGVRIHYSKGCH